MAMGRGEGEKQGGGDLHVRSTQPKQWPFFIALASESRTLGHTMR